MVPYMSLFFVYPSVCIRHPYDPLCYFRISFRNGGRLHTRWDIDTAEYTHGGEHAHSGTLEHIHAGIYIHRVHTHCSDIQIEKHTFRKDVTYGEEYTHGGDIRMEGGQGTHFGRDKTHGHTHTAVGGGIDTRWKLGSMSPTLLEESRKSFTQFFCPKMSHIPTFSIFDFDGGPFFHRPPSHQKFFWADQQRNSKSPADNHHPRRVLPATKSIQSRSFRQWEQHTNPTAREVEFGEERSGPPPAPPHTHTYTN